jgi:hypothetical protein
MIMQEETLIPATLFCTHHQIEVSLLHSLHEYGLAEIEQRNEEISYRPISLGDGKATSFAL